MHDRRTLLAAAAAALGAATGARAAALPFANGDRPLVRYPQKRPLLRLTTRPPQLETPFEIFGESLLTPNDAFFVRYHLAGSPPQLDPKAWRLSITGAVERPLDLSLADLKRDFRPLDQVAVLQCSGNGRGFSEPRVGGGQIGNGMMGSARWTGVPLKAVLERAGLKPGAAQVAFNGADTPPGPGIADFVKTLDLAHATDGEVMLAFAMNGQDLPVLNGYPLRLVVPGWYGTYWIKHLTGIEVLDKPIAPYWMQTAYRIPDTDCACVLPGATPAATVPINRLNVRAFITSHADGARVRAGRLPLRGIAFDGGAGIRAVEISTDGGKSWTPAALGPDQGRYGFRAWAAPVALPPGAHALQVRATNAEGEGQPAEAHWNPSGYMRNVIETVRVTAA